MPTKNIEKWIVLADGEHASAPIALKADAEQTSAHRAATNAQAIASALVAQSRHEAERQALVDAGLPKQALALEPPPGPPAVVAYKVQKVKVPVGFRVRSSRDGEVVCGPFLDSAAAESERERLNGEQRSRVDELRDPTTGAPLTDGDGNQLAWAQRETRAVDERGNRVLGEPLIPERPNTYWIDEIEMPLEPQDVPDPVDLHDNPDAFGEGGLPLPTEG